MSTPNEVYRKDLVSAMLVTELPDCAHAFPLHDNWKTEWERGVQVPAKAKQKEAKVVELDHVPEPPIEVPRHRPRYCLDNLDCAWLDLANQHRTAAALPRLTEDDLELIIDDFETQANSTIRQRCNNKKANTLEDNSVCDVCRSPHGEDGNELVFCDGCDICVHQHCYGINDLDQPKWFCRPCQENIKPKCYLCAQYGGAMTKAIGWEKLEGCLEAPWVHIQCALWIPEVTMTKPDRMSDPDLSQIPESRRSLRCYVCQNQVGCVQCNVKKCFKSYHVTCGVRNGQSVRMEHKGGQVNLISNCDKHSEQKSDEIRKRRTSIDQQIDEERRILEENFFTLVSLEHARNRLQQFSMDTLDWVFEYWRLRRRSNGNAQLIPENDGEPEAATAEQRYRRITQLRTDLEKSRNLLCLIMKRERVKRQILRCDREIKLKEMKFLGSKVELSESTKSELTKSETDDQSDTVKTEADDAAQFLEELDLERSASKPPTQPSSSSREQGRTMPKPNHKINPQRTKNSSKSDEKGCKKEEEATKNEAESVAAPLALPSVVDNAVAPPTPMPSNATKTVKSVPRVNVKMPGRSQSQGPVVASQAATLSAAQRLPNPATVVAGVSVAGSSLRTSGSGIARKTATVKVNPPFPHSVRPFRGQEGSITRLNGPMRGPRPPHNGPTTSFEGKTVIGTKTVGGQQQQITMDNRALHRNFRNCNANAVGTPVRYREPPPNLVVSTKMVGGKEVQLVTPNPRPKIRFVRPSVPGQPGGNSVSPAGAVGIGSKTTVTISSAVARGIARSTPIAVSSPGGVSSFNSVASSGPIKVNHPGPSGQVVNHPGPSATNSVTQPKIPVNVRTAVGGANEKNLPKSLSNSKSSNAKAPGIIKLGPLTKKDQKEQKDQNEQNAAKEEDVSTRQIAEKWLGVKSSSRKINKKLSDQSKPTINKATELLLEKSEKAKKDPNPEKTSDKVKDEKKKSKGLSFGSSLFSKAKNPTKTTNEQPLDNCKTAFLNRMLKSIAKTSQKVKPSKPKKSPFVPRKSSLIESMKKESFERKDQKENADKNHEKLPSSKNASKAENKLKSEEKNPDLGNAESGIIGNSTENAQLPEKRDETLHESGAVSTSDAQGSLPKIPVDGEIPVGLVKACKVNLEKLTPEKIREELESEKSAENRVTSDPKLESAVKNLTRLPVPTVPSAKSDVGNEVQEVVEEVKEGEKIKVSENVLISGEKRRNDSPIPEEPPAKVAKPGDMGENSATSASTNGPIVTIPVSLSEPLLSPGPMSKILNSVGEEVSLSETLKPADDSPLALLPPSTNQLEPPTGSSATEVISNKAIGKVRVPEQSDVLLPDPAVEMDPLDFLTTSLSSELNTDDGILPIINPAPAKNSDEKVKNPVEEILGAGENSIPNPDIPIPDAGTIPNNEDDDDMPLDALLIKGPDPKPEPKPVDELPAGQTQPMAALQEPLPVDKILFPVGEIEPSLEKVEDVDKLIRGEARAGPDGGAVVQNVSAGDNPLDLIFGRSESNLFDPFSSDIFGSSSHQETNPLADIFGPSSTSGNVPASECAGIVPPPVPVSAPNTALANVSNPTSHAIPPAPDSISPVDGMLGNIPANSQSTGSPVEGLEDLFEDINKETEKLKQQQQQQLPPWLNPRSDSEPRNVPAFPIPPNFAAQLTPQVFESPKIKNEPPKRNEATTGQTETNALFAKCNFPPTPPTMQHSAPVPVPPIPTAGNKLDLPIVQKAQELLKQQQLRNNAEAAKALTNHKQEPKSRRKSLSGSRDTGRGRKKSIGMDIASSTLADLLKSRSPIMSPTPTLSSLQMPPLMPPTQLNKTPPPSGSTANPILNQVIANMIQQQQQRQPKQPTAEDIQRQAKMILEQSKLSSINKTQLTPPSAQTLQSLLSSTGPTFGATGNAAATATAANSLLGNNPFWGGLRNIFNSNEATGQSQVANSSTSAKKNVDEKPTLGTQKAQHKSVKAEAGNATATAKGQRGRPVNKQKGQRLEEKLASMREKKGKEERERETAGKREHKIVHSPNVREVTTLETPSGTITLTPTKKMAKSLSVKRRNVSGLSSDSTPKKRPRKSKSPTPLAHAHLNAQSPSRSKSPLPKAAHKGKLPKLRISRANDQSKWRIEHVFKSHVTDAEIDCTPILDRLSRRRTDVKMTPPPLQRAPPKTHSAEPGQPITNAHPGRTEPSSKPSRHLPTLSPAPSSNSSDIKCDLDLGSLAPSSTPTGSVHQPVRLKIRLSRNNNRPITQSSTLRSTPRKAKSQVKYTVDSWWDDS